VTVDNVCEILREESSPLAIAHEDFDNALPQNLELLSAPRCLPVVWDVHSEWLCGTDWKSSHEFYWNGVDNFYRFFADNELAGRG
jgi:hypothetical protein